MNLSIFREPQFPPGSPLRGLVALFVALLSLAGCSSGQTEIALPAGAGAGIPTLVYVYTDG